MHSAEPNSPNCQAHAGVFTRERLKVMVLLGATVAVGYLCFRIAEPFLPALTWAVALAVMWRPVHHEIARVIRSEGAAATVSVALIAVVLAGPVAVLSTSLVGQARDIAQTLHDSELPRQAERLREAADGHESLRPVLNWLRERLDVESELQRSLTGAVRNTSVVVRGTVWGIAQTLVMLLVLFYLFRDESAALQAVRRLLPLSTDESGALFARVNDTIHATIYGTLVVAAVQGLLGGLMFLWLGLPAPVLWGCVMGLLAVVPYLGAFVVWGSAAALLAVGGNWGQAAALTAWGLIVVGLIDNLLYPLLVGNRLRLHTLVAFFAILGGFTVFGASGIVLGPVVVAILLALIDLWRGRTAGGEAPDGD